MKKQLETNPTAEKQTVQITPEVAEQLKELMAELKKVEPVFTQLNNGIKLIVNTVLGQAGVKLTEAKELSLDDQNWTLSYTK